MSSEVIVGKRYARALLEAARERGLIAEVAQELKLVAAAVEETDGFQNVWENPSFSAAVKKQMIESVLAGKVSEVVINTIKLMVDKGREDLLGTLSEQYAEAANEALGQAVAQVYSVAPLTEDDMKSVAATFSQLTGKTIIVENIVNPGLLGGLQVRIGDRLYDGSLSGKLQRLGKTLSQNV